MRSISIKNNNVFDEALKNKTFSSEQKNKSGGEFLSTLSEVVHLFYIMRNSIKTI